jgi:hypothetical protein
VENVVWSMGAVVGGVGRNGGSMSIATFSILDGPAPASLLLATLLLLSKLDLGGDLEDDLEYREPLCRRRDASRSR